MKRNRVLKRPARPFPLPFSLWPGRGRRGGRSSGDVGKEFGITQKTLRSHAYLPHSPHYEADGGGDQESPTFASWWETANQFNVIVRRLLNCANLPSLYLSCFILYYLSNFSLGLCAFLSSISFISIWIIGPNYTVQADQTQMEIKSIIRWKQKKWRLYRFCSTRINVGVLRRSSRLVPATSPAWARPINLFPAKNPEIPLYCEVTRCHMLCRSGGYPKIKCISIERSRWEDYFCPNHHGWIPSGYRDLTKKNFFYSGGVA